MHYEWHIIKTHPTIKNVEHNTPLKHRVYLMFAIDYCCQVIKMFHLFKKLVVEDDREDVTRSIWFNLHDLVPARARNFVVPRYLKQACLSESCS